MDRTVTLYDLFPSPNSMKVRCALAYKKISYTKISVDPSQRDAVVKVSGQPLTPVLTHGESVVYDSYGILRYLDANWHEAPRLFSSDRDAVKKIEEWEMFGRTQVGPIVRTMFAEFRAPLVDARNFEKANSLLKETAATLEDTLSMKPFLMGDAPNAADFTVATMLSYGLLKTEDASKSPIHAFALKHLSLEGNLKVKTWAAQVLYWDR